MRLLTTVKTVNVQALRDIDPFKSRRKRDGMLRELAGVQLNFMQRRYQRLSAGRGEWEPLSPSTIRQKMRGTEEKPKIRGWRKGGRFSAAPVMGRRRARLVLIDSGRTFQALTPGAPDNLIRITDQGVTAGVQGRAGKLASIHALGGPNLPKRKIIVPPDATTKRRMKEVVIEWIEK